MALCKSNVGVQFVFGYLIVFMDLSISQCASHCEQLKQLNIEGIHGN